VSWTVSDLHRAAAVGEALRRRGFELIGERRWKDLTRWVQQHPALLGDPLFATQWNELGRKGWLRPAVGRPAEQFTLHPLHAYAWVDHLLRFGEAPTLERALQLLAERTELSYDVLKRQYYEARKRMGLQPALFVGQ
jgi:hypothetical protein